MQIVKKKKLLYLKNNINNNEKHGFSFNLMILHCLYSLTVLGILYTY